MEKKIYIEFCNFDFFILFVIFLGKISIGIVIFFLFCYVRIYVKGYYVKNKMKG